MDSSVRKRSALNHSLVSPSAQLPKVHQESESEKERKIRKLSMINRELIDTLKKQNEDLTKKINKQKMKEGMRRVSQSQSVHFEETSEKTKKELANAYKQIEMYKSALQGLKAKEISSESADKLKNIQNSIRHEDTIIDQLQSELKYLTNIKDQQEKELHIYQNEDVQASISQLQNELKGLKERLKEIKRENTKLQEKEKKQHEYCIQLEKVLRKHNGDYYPGKTEKEAKEQIEEVSEREWQLLKAELNSLKKNHQAYNNKIEQLSRQRNTQLKSCEENELIFKQKQRKLTALKGKIAQIKKLLSFKEKVTENPNEEHANEYGDNYQMVIKDGKKVYQLKNPQKEREAKKWNMPQGYCLQKGKILPNSTFFSDKPALKGSARWKITGARVWCDAVGTVSLVQFVYSDEENKTVEGIMAMYPQSQEQVVVWTEGDYLARIQGKLHNDHIVSLTFVSKFGKSSVFNQQAEGQHFSLEPRPNEIPSCVFGACTKNEEDEIRMCHIGCEFVVDW